MKKFILELLIDNKPCTLIDREGEEEEIVKLEVSMFLEKQGFKNFTLKTVQVKEN